MGLQDEASAVTRRCAGVKDCTDLQAAAGEGTPIIFIKLELKPWKTG